MSINDALAVSSGLLVFLYYLSAWWLVGRDPKIGSVTTRYEPPGNLSPAMLRYVWKQTFDDRAFWAAVLGLVAKGAIQISHDEGVLSLNRNPAAQSRTMGLAPEERLLLRDLMGGKNRKTVKLTMLDESAERAIADVCDSLRIQALGRWFRENTQYAITGAALSCVPIIFAARPASVDEWVALVIEFGVMVPGAFYGMFLATRLKDLFRITRGNVFRLARRTFVLMAIFSSCVLAIIFGFTMLALTFGLFVFATALALVILGVTFTHLLRAPTQEGTRLLTEIEGFREFLRSVEKLPLDMNAAPAGSYTHYDQYLPYAVALEVEQGWSDRLVALGSTTSETWRNLHATCYHLGIWRGKPVDLVVGPPNRR